MDTTKIIKGVVNNRRYTVTAPIVKEDYGLFLQIEGIELPTSYQVDFSNSENSGFSVTMIGNADGVLIPSQFISSGKDVFAFLYHVGADYGRTVYKFRIPNKVRPDRTEETPTPEQASVIDQAISALNEAVAQTAQDVIDADASAQSAQGYASQAETAKTNAQTYANNASASATSASQSAQASANSATASAQSASQSAQIKSDVEDMVDDAQGYASASAQSASESANSASQASSSATSASQSASSAQGYASQAQTSAQTASTKASEASISAQTASNKASEASQSASQALSYKTDAESAKTASQTAQGLTESARDLAQGYAEDAQGYANDAQASAESISASASQIAQNTADILKAFPTDTASGSIASFSDGADGIPLKSLIVDIDPVQDLSNGDPSPENICPISGWTEVHPNISGINVWDEEWEGGDINVSNGEPRDNASRIRSKNFIQVRPNTVFYSKSSYPNTIVCFYGKDKEWVTPSGYAVAIDRTFTTPSWCYWIKLYCNTTAYANDISINYPSTDHSYHPYTGRSITIELGQTVYGGKLDVLSGELVVDRKYEKFDGSEDETWYTYGSSGYRVPKRDIGSSGNGICNLAPTVSSASSYGVMFSANNNYIYFFQAVSKWGVATIADLRAWLATNNVEVCYELAQPITYHLDPHAINSLYGVNNIWADSGDCTAEYRADTKLFIARLTEPDADMIADANIVSGQYFMVGNSLYKATANIANGAQIIVGTNATRKSLSDALNEINA